MAASIPWERLRDSGGRYVHNGTGVSWVGLESVAQAMVGYGAAIHAARLAACESVAPQMEAYMQENAPWEDDSGDARAKLRVVVIDFPEQFRTEIHAGHGVKYGVFLETMQGGQYAIVLPTVHMFAPLVMGQIRDELK